MRRFLQKSSEIVKVGATFLTLELLTPEAARSSSSKVVLTSQKIKL